MGLGCEIDQEIALWKMAQVGDVLLDVAVVDVRLEFLIGEAVRGVVDYVHVGDEMPQLEAALDEVLADKAKAARHKNQFRLQFNIPL